MTQLALSAAFDAVFGVFVVALAVLFVVTIRWAVRRDRAGREAWARRREAAASGDGVSGGPVVPAAPRADAAATPARRRDRRRR